jgi:sporulation protein YlmC with PRC-barrel domain
MAQSTRIASSDTASASPDSRNGRTAGPQRADERRARLAEVMGASSLEGETVLDVHGETLGEIEDIMLDVPAGRIAYAVIAVGGFLGIGEKYFAVPWRALIRDADRKCFVLDLDKDRLAEAPGFDEDHWPSMADEQWAREIQRFYGPTLTGNDCGALRRRKNKNQPG